MENALAWITGGWQQSPYAKTENDKLGIDVDGVWGFQCIDFSEAYSIFLGSPFNLGIVRNAITLWTNDQPGWTKVTDPKAGDVFCKDYVGSDGIDYGHTGVVASVTDTGIWGKEQNWFNSSLEFGSPPADVFHPFSTIKGYLRCDKIGANEMLITEDNLKYLYMGIYGQDPNLALSPTDPEIGQDYATTTERLLDYANKNNFAYWQVKPALEKQIADLEAQLKAVAITPVVDAPPAQATIPATVTTPGVDASVADAPVSPQTSIVSKIINFIVVAALKIWNAEQTKKG